MNSEEHLEFLNQRFEFFKNKFENKTITINDNTSITSRLSHISAGMRFDIKEIINYGFSMDTNTFLPLIICKCLLDQTEYKIENKLIHNNKDFENDDVFYVNVMDVHNDFIIS